MIYHVTFGMLPDSYVGQTQFGSSWKSYLKGLTQDDWDAYNAMVTKNTYGTLKYPTLKFEEKLPEWIKSGKDDTYVFILTNVNDQTKAFDAYLERHGLKEYEIFRTPGFTNHNHPERPGNLVMVFLQSKDHFQRNKVIK